MNKLNVLVLVKTHESILKDGFYNWMNDNYHVFDVFCGLTNKMYDAGRQFYSARTIAEKMRFDHDIAEVNSTFKIGNNTIPDMARLYVLLYPDRLNMFAYRRNGEFQKYVSTIGIV